MERAKTQGFILFEEFTGDLLHLALFKPPSGILISGELQELGRAQ